MPSNCASIPSHTSTSMQTMKVTTENVLSGAREIASVKVIRIALSPLGSSVGAACSRDAMPGQDWQRRQATNDSRAERRSDRKVSASDRRLRLQDECQNKSSSPELKHNLSLINCHIANR